MIDQMMIGVFGVAAIWLSQDLRPERRRWASVCGLIAQPFWFYATWTAGQYGIFALSFLYAASWMRGFYGYWIMPGFSDKGDKWL